MGEQNNILPDYFDLEDQRSELINSILNISSATLRVFSYYKYFVNILQYQDQKTEDAFLKEFVDDYFSALSRWEVWGIDPSFTGKFIEHLKELKEKPVCSEFSTVLENYIVRLESQLNNLLSILDGKETSEDYEHKAYFPLIDKTNSDGFYGIIDSVTIRISKAAAEDNFILVPSEENIDKRIIEQYKISWKLALTRLKPYVKKPYKYHEVIINLPF